MEKTIVRFQSKITGEIMEYEYKHETMTEETFNRIMGLVLRRQGVIRLMLESFYDGNSPDILIRTQLPIPKWLSNIPKYYPKIKLPHQAVTDGKTNQLHATDAPGVSHG